MSPVLEPRLRLPDALNTLRTLRQALASDMEKHVLDLSVLRDADSSALAVLLALRREYGSRIAFANPPERLRSLARLYGAESLILSTASQEPRS